ncbi:MAG: aminotransferase class V-fold PLP-dependent enzyme [Gemmatimonadaceae bacterium]
MNKREFLRTVGSVSLGAMFGPGLLEHYRSLSPSALAEDEVFWTTIRGKFKLTSEYINLENGFYCLQPEVVLDAFIAHVRSINVQASRYMRTRQADDKLRVRQRLAAMGGVSPEELVITRNTTEALDTVISGYDWKAGDEAIQAVQDYGAMLDQFKLQARRYGMVNRLVSLPSHPQSDAELVQLYANAITPRTRLLLVSHMVNISGQVMPVRAIADMAHERGVDVLVDGAHTFGHLHFAIPDLHGDYYGASLHKWLGTPLGAGILYVRKEKIATLWPIFGDEGPGSNDIRKLNHTGTHPVHTDLAIENALDFHESIGGERKEARLRYLQVYWTRQVRDLPRVVVNTPADPKRTGAIANVGVQGIEPGDLAKRLMETYRVWTVAIDSPNVRGVRVTPHLFTTTEDLDALVKAIRELSAA